MTSNEKQDDEAGESYKIDYTSIECIFQEDSDFKDKDNVWRYIQKEHPDEMPGIVDHLAHNCTSFYDLYKPHNLTQLEYLHQYEPQIVTECVKRAIDILLAGGIESKHDSSEGRYGMVEKCEQLIYIYFRLTEGGENE